MSAAGAVFPVGLHLDGRRCAVVGPLASAAPRLAALQAAGAAAVHLGESVPDAATLRGAFLCLVTEDAPEDVARAAAAAARSAGALVWCGDRPALSDLSLPAVLRRGRVVVTVSTGGASPALAVRLRDELAALLGEELGQFAEALAAARAAARARHPD
ncbi:MAG TPA: siroheme synthase, partial [Myxococcota bacterium]|nr:siroheme synthase [Myxococcota bacterium]